MFGDSPDQALWIENEKIKQLDTLEK